jgi:hypothetical protein
MDNGMKHHSIKAWEDAPPPLIIRSLDTGRELFRINADGSVVGEIEDASEAAKVFFESLRGYLPQPQTDALRIKLLEDAVIAVVEATRAYLPPDGIDAQECISRILEATDNSAINPVIFEIEGRAALDALGFEIREKGQ